MNLIDELNKRRGLIVSHTALASHVSRNFEHMVLASFHIYYTQEYTPVTSCAGEITIALFGRAINPFTSSNSIVEELTNALTYGSLEKFHEVIDQLTGRFAIFLADHNNARLYHDACGMQGLFYTNCTDCKTGASKLVSTSPVEIASILGIRKDDSVRYLRKYTSFHLPGDITQYPTILQLVPNHYLDLATNTPVRFWPRFALSFAKTSKEVDKILNDAGAILQTTFEKLYALEKPLVCSLTAGVDSRVTFAASRKISGNIKYFTYHDKLGREDVWRLDKSVVENIRNNLHINHDFLEISDDPELNDITSILLRKSYTTHLPGLLPAYYDKYRNAIHVRSNILEVARRFYKKAHPNLSLPFDAAKASFCYYPPAEKDSTVNELFDIFLKRNSFDAIHNYDPFDMFYWEYRMGIWHSQVCSETDGIFESFVLFNNRHLLSSLLSIPPERRSGYALWKELIYKMWPVATFFGINDRQDLFSNKPSLASQSQLSLSDIYAVESVGRDELAPAYDLRLMGDQGIQIAFYASNPKARDQIRLKIRIDNPKSKVTYSIRHPYGGNSCIGKFKVTTYYNDVELHSYEIESDRPSLYTFDVSCYKKTKPSSLVIELICLMDLPPWGWGKLSSTHLERVFSH